MRKIFRIVLATASFLTISCTYADQHEADGSGDEIIVKFATDQPINETVVRAFDDMEAEASLKESVRELSAELSVPFVYSRLTSGREIVVEISEQQVVKLVAERIRDSDDVKSMSIEKRTVSGTSNGVDEILVTVDNDKVDLDEYDAEEVASWLVNDERLPVNCDVRDDGRLAVTPDFELLVGDLVNELTGRRDVEYAQPNYKVRHFNNSQ